MWLLMLALSVSGTALAFPVKRDVGGNKDIECYTHSISTTNATVTCKFKINLAEEKYSFYVVLIDVNANDTKEAQAVLSCNWLNKDRPTCLMENGYFFDYAVTDEITIHVPRETLDKGMKFQCHIAPSSEDRKPIPCDKNTTCPSNPTTTTTMMPFDNAMTTTPATTTTPIADSSASMQPAMIVVIVVVVILVVAVILLSIAMINMWKRKASSASVKDHGKNSKESMPMMSKERSKSEEDASRASEESKLESKPEEDDSSESEESKLKSREEPDGNLSEEDLLTPSLRSFYMRKDGDEKSVTERSPPNSPQPDPQATSTSTPVTECRSDESRDDAITSKSPWQSTDTIINQ